MRKLVVARRLSQAFFLVLFVYTLWSTTYPLTGLLAPDTFFKLNPFSMIITSISGRVVFGGILFSLAMILATLVVGRFFCGWICPLGAVIDGVGAMRKKSRPLGDAANRKVSRVKFIVLAVIFLCAVFGFQIAWVFDPMVIMARFVSVNLIPTVHSAIILAFFLAITASALLLKRAWCRIVCPLGALYALIARFSLLRRRVDDCGQCKMCGNNCRTGAIRNDLSYAKGECILCMDCIYDCPTRGTRFVWPWFKEKSVSSGHK